MKNILLTSVVFFITLIFPIFANAAILNIVSDKEIIKKGETMIVSIELDTEGQSLNVIEADLTYDKNLVRPVSINIGNSVINFWIEKPEIKKEGTILV
jgi:hypothetical protein